MCFFSIRFSRQLIGGLTKLARSGLWKASFKVLRVEQALNARKVAAARENGEVTWLNLFVSVVECIQVAAEG